MAELYVRVKQPEVLLKNDYSIKNRVDALSEAAKTNLSTLKVFINTEYEGVIFTPHYLTPALTIILDENTHDVSRVLEVLRSQPYVDMAEKVS